MKHKKGKKTGGARHRPAHLAAVAGANDAEAAEFAGPEMGGTEERLTEYLEQLRSDDPSVRELGAAAIGMLAGAPDNVESALKIGLENALIACLRDETHTAVKAEAAGALRNIVIGAADPQISTKLVESGIMTAISKTLPAAVALIMNRAAEIAGGAVITPAQRRETEALQNLVEQTVRLMWELGESSEMAMTVLNSGGIGAAVIRCLSSAESALLPTEILLSTAMCLQTISEDNPMVARLVNGSPASSANLLQLFGYSASTAGNNAALQVAAAGSVLNIITSSAAEAAGGAVSIGELEGVPEVLDTVGAVVATDTAASMGELAAALPQLRKSSGDSDVMKTVQDFNTLLRAQRNGFEVLANSCFVDVDGDQWEDVGDEEDEEDADLEVEVDANGSYAGGAEGAAAVFGLLAERGLPGAVLARCTQLHRGVQQLFAGNGSHGLPMLAAYHQMQARAIGCLSNLFGIIQLEVVGLEFVEACWSTLAAHVTAPPVGVTEEFAEVVTAAAWALLRLASSNGTAITGIMAEHVKALCALVVPTTGEAVRINVVGALGCIGAMGPTADLMGMVGAALLQSLDDGCGWVVAEGLNGLFDGFAEPPVNEIFVTLQMPTKLQALLVKLRQEIKAGKRTMDRALLGKLDETKLNLSRFIKYKAAQF